MPIDVLTVADLGSHARSPERQPQITSARMPIIFMHGTQLKSHSAHTGSIVSIDIATSEVVSATSAMNSTSEAPARVVSSALVARASSSTASRRIAPRSGHFGHSADVFWLILSMFFAGMAGGQLVYGPISDSTGRKPALYLGIGLFMIGGAICALTHSFAWLLIGRALSGFGAAGPRIVSVALVRDAQAGSSMARVMSFVL